MKTWLLAFAAPLALTAQPLAAQEEMSSEDEQALAAMAQMFAAEPLTPEQEARLPLATSLVAKILPEGSMAEIMNSMFDGFLDPLMKLAAEAGPDLTEHIGYSASELELSDEQAAEAAALVDPNWRERQEREFSMLQGMIGRVMTAMEPAMRKGMSEAYAVHFTEPELRDIDAFFSTESGASYARKSFALSSDPRIMGAAMQQMPVMMEQFATIGAEMEAAMADLGEKPTFETLPASRKARLLELTGLSEEELQSGMEAAAAAEAESGPFG